MSNSLHLHLIKCPKCGYILAKKNGHNKQRKQRYMCKDCGYQYIEERGKKPKTKKPKQAIKNKVAI